MLHALLLTAALAAAPAAQSPAPTPAKKNQPITLTGCISQAPGQTGTYTFENEAGGSYRLSGKNIKKFAGQRVEIVGGTPKLSIVGGLYPSPNVAAQAGAIDPAQAAIARQPGGGSRGTGPESLPEFRVSGLRALTGGCR